MDLRLLYHQLKIYNKGYVLHYVLTKYSTILQIQYHEEQDIMSTFWLLEGKDEEERAIKQNYIELYSKTKFSTPRGGGVLGIFFRRGCAIFRGIVFTYLFYDGVSKEGNFSGNGSQKRSKGLFC